MEKENNNKKTPETHKTLFEEKKVLDKGFVRLVDYMGDDARIVQSARVSYGAGTKTLREDRGLIRYLLRNAHTSPFEQVVLTFHIKMPIFVARQWVRHRTARLNEISARYSIMEDEFYVPEKEDINAQSDDNKQGRDEAPLPIEIQNSTVDSLDKHHEQSYKLYQDLLDTQVAREISRITLPTSLYTQMYWQIDLHNLFHFLRLRMDAHAQKEIRDYSQIMYNIVKELCPLSAEAFEDYILHKIEFYTKEQTVLAKLISQKEISDEDIDALAKETGISSARERHMFIQKIRNISAKKTTSTSS